MLVWDDASGWDRGRGQLAFSGQSAKPTQAVLVESDLEESKIPMLRF